MFFNSFAFVSFLCIILILISVNHLFWHNLQIRNIILLVGSYTFYAYFNFAFTLILAFVTLINYIIGNVIIDNIVSKKKQIIAVGIILSLLPLVFYKYAFFLCSSLSVLLRLETDLELIDGLILPVGISFFTFQALTYSIDAYRGKIIKKAPFLNFALFVSFFPTILSGPIEKARNILPQIAKYFYPTVTDFIQGTTIFVWGLFKKIVIADRLASYVDWVYSSSHFESGVTLAVAAGFYSIQIYCDFSGYSDMALGVAKSLGFNITKNFRQPYFSRTFKEFWRKWHIALTSWFTEYVYFSLGGSRVKSKLRWIFNVSTIFILSGIWHGASWSFVVWGALHAVYYLIEHFVGLQRNSIVWKSYASVLSGLYVFIMVTIAWIFFRVESFSESVYIIDKIFTDSGGEFSMGSSSFSFACTVLMLLVFFLYEILIYKKKICFDVEGYRAVVSRNVIAIVPMLLMLGLFGMSSESFVYFQF